jgi:hypothetical protein
MAVQRRLSTAISREKNKLIARVQRNGLYENFGQKEIMNLQDKFIDSSDYTDDMKVARKMLGGFQDWAMSYNG